MIPQVGQEVCCHLKSGIQLQGVVVEWNNKIVLQSNNKTIITVINNPIEDIVYYRIFLKNLNELKKEVVRDPSNNEKINSLVELKKELNILEREQIKEKLRSHQITGPTMVNYGLPTNIFKNTSAVQHTKKEVSRTNSSFEEGLQDLFSNKNK